MPESMAVPLGGPYVDPTASESVRIPAGIIMAMATFSPGRRTCLKADDPYGDSISPDGLAPVCHVQEIRIPASEGLWSGKTGGIFIRRRQTSLYLPAENRGGDGNVCYKGRGAEP